MGGRLTPGTREAAWASHTVSHSCSVLPVARASLGSRGWTPCSEFGVRPVGGREEPGLQLRGAGVEHPGDDCETPRALP